MPRNREPLQDTFIGSDQTWTFDNEQDAQPTGEYKLGLAEQALKGQDRLLVMEEQGVFAIFDGMGGKGGSDAGAVASALAYEIFWTEYSADEGFGRDVDKEKDRLIISLAKADQMIAVGGDMGTTAIALKMVQHGEGFKAVWSCVGDSRLYLYRDDNLHQISVDEGHGHMLTNALGIGGAEISQIAALNLEPGDRLMLCSDGITGDYDEDVLSVAELKNALSATTPQAAANELLRASRKRDDKSVIVLDFEKGELNSSALQEHIMGHDEVLPIDSNHPLEKRGGFNVLAKISASKKKEFLLLDLRPTDPVGRKRTPFGESVGHWSSDLLLVDETFFGKWGVPEKGQGGYKGIRSGDNLAFGRSNYHGRFSMPDTVSRHHFNIYYDGENISLINIRPTNSTIVTLNKS
jgi:PPM family protein phosphatase